MFAIHNYTDTKCELDMAKNRLNLLMDKKKKLYYKYFPLTSKIKEISVDGKNGNKEKVLDYLHELHEIDIGTGMSLADEILYQHNIINQLEGYITKMSNSLSKMSGIEYKLYYEIVYNGTSISKAVEQIASENNKKIDTIWKNYYRKIKKDIKKLKYPLNIQ